MFWLLPDHLHWLWTCDADSSLTDASFSGQKLNKCLWPWNVEGQCQTSARSTKKKEGNLMLWLLLGSCQLPHVNIHIPHTENMCFLRDLPSSHCQTLICIVVSTIIFDDWGGSTHPLDVLSDCEPMEEFSALLSQSFTSWQRIYTGEKKNTSTAIRAFAITEFSNLCSILQKRTCELL